MKRIYPQCGSRADKSCWTEPLVSESGAMGFVSKRSEAERPVRGPGLSMLCTMGLSFATFVACSTCFGLWQRAGGGSNPTTGTITGAGCGFDHSLVGARRSDRHSSAFRWAGGRGSERRSHHRINPGVWTQASDPAVRTTPDVDAPFAQHEGGGGFGL